MPFRLCHSITCVPAAVDGSAELVTSVLVVDTEVKRGKEAVDGSGIVEVGGALVELDDEDTEVGAGVVDVVLGVVVLLLVVVVGTCGRQVQ